MAKKNAKPIMRRGLQGFPCENDLEFIFHGHCMLDGDSPSDTPENLWARYGKLIMELQGQPCGNLVPWHCHKPYFFDYFERPALWWLCGPGAEEPRRLLSGDEQAMALPGRPLFFGVPSCFRRHDHGCIYESQRDYLIRRGLLTDAEKALLAG